MIVPTTKPRAALARPTYSQIRERAQRLHRQIVDRARRVAKQAGLDPALLFLHAHNAKTAYDHGCPWPGVDYDLVRQVLYLQQLSWQPHRLLRRWCRRMDREQGPFWILERQKERQDAIPMG